MVAVAWCLALICSIPQFFLFKLESHHYCDSNQSFQVTRSGSTMVLIPCRTQI
jgi:hypothetical protein